MVANFTRVDTLELKDLIYRKTGHERAEKYFNQLKRFLSLKISKAEFDKSCIQTIGRENISLHNRLIRSIIQNACGARTPPRKARKVESPNGNQRSVQSLYGEAFPRKCRSPVSRDAKFRDRPSPLGPLGKSPSITCEETVTRTHEQQSATELHSLCSRPPIEDGEEVEQCAGNISSRNWSHVTAPLGVSINSKSSHCGFKDDTCAVSCGNTTELPDTISLRSRLQKKCEMEGVGISMEFAQVLNIGLNELLKRMIEPSFSIASSATSDTECGNVSALDFRVAMESNPHLLGADWPIQLEKIQYYASEE